VGPHALRTRRAKDPAGADDPRTQSTTRAPSWSPSPSSPGHGRPHAANPALTTCAQPCHSLGAPRPYLLPDRRAILFNRWSLAGHAIEPGPLPEILHDDDQVSPTSPLAQHGLRRRRGAGSGSGSYPSRSRVRQGGQTHGLAVWLSDAPTRSMKSPVRTQRTRTGTRNVRTPTPDTRTAGHRDIGHRTRGHRTRGHWTLDTGTLTEDADRATKPRQASDIWATATSRRLAGRRTVFLWEAAPAALGNHDGSAVRPPPARETAPPPPGNCSLAPPAVSGASAHCSPQTIAG